MRPRDFWALHPQEFFWLADGYDEKRQIQQRESGRLTEDEAKEMLDELKHARVAAGFPPE